MDKHTKKTPSLFRYPVLVAFGIVNNPTDSKRF